MQLAKENGVKSIAFPDLSIFHLSFLDQIH
ncbi:hypothetical protein [Blautia sp.]